MIEILQNHGVIAIPGDLDIGLADGDRPAEVRVVGGNTVITLASRVRVLATGSFDVNQFSQSIASLTIDRGYVNIGQDLTTGGLLSAGSLTMTGGTLHVGTPSCAIQARWPGDDHVEHDGQRHHHGERRTPAQWHGDVHHR